MKSFLGRFFGKSSPEKEQAPEPAATAPTDGPSAAEAQPKAFAGATQRVMPIQGPDGPKIPSQCVNTLRFIAVSGAGPWMFMSPEPERACDSAKNQIGSILGSEDGVSLPLKSCNKVTCLCFYQRQTDSRSALRRATDRPGERIEALKLPAPENERRAGRGRRRSDPRS
jgi:hypothetical protein